MLLTVVAAGCGRLGFDDHTPPNDVGITTGDTGDAACTLGPWGPLRALTDLNTTANEFGDWLSADRLQMLWSSDRTGAFQVYSALRPSISDPFGAATVIELGGPSFGDPYESPDGLSLWVDKTGMQQIALATRSDPAAAFSTPMMRAELAVGQQEFNPSLSPDQLTIAFDTSTTTKHIYRATRATPTAAFSTPQIFAELDIGGDNCCPAFSGDGSLMLLASDAGTSATILRIYESDAGPSGFGTPFPFVATGNAGPGGLDSDPYITPDGRTVIIASNRPGGLGAYDLYETDRDCE